MNLHDFRRSRQGRPSAIVIVVVCLGVGCQVLVPSDVYQCTTDDDCAARGAAFESTTCVERVCAPLPATTAADADADASGPAVDASPVDPKWGCIGSVKWNAQSESEQVLQRWRFVQLLSEAPIKGLRVRACSRLDLQCDRPVVEADSDERGYVTMNVPKYFDGFVLVPAPPSLPDLMPTINYVLPPPETSMNPTEEIAINRSIHLATTNDFNVLLVLAGSSADAAHGHLLGHAIDCAGAAAAGVFLHSDLADDKTVPYYVESGGFPSVTATETGPGGESGFMNLPPGSRKIDSFVRELGNKRMASQTALIRAGYVTHIAFLPVPGVY